MTVLTNSTTPPTPPMDASSKGMMGGMAATAGMILLTSAQQHHITITQMDLESERSISNMGKRSSTEHQSDISANLTATNDSLRNAGS